MAAAAAVLPSATSLRFPRKGSCRRLPPLPPYPPNLFLALKSVQRKRVVMQLKRKGTSVRPLCVGRSHGPNEPHHNSHLVPLSPLTALAHDFYSSLNEKNHQRLHELIADDCVFNDLAFSKPFKGKEVHHFLKNLTAAMGKDVKFIIERVYEGREPHEDRNSSIVVLWHLEWQERRIPFATGCSFYDCSIDGESPLIKRATVYFESPLKPGEFVLELLKIISALFDQFPNQAKWFLEKPHAMIKFMIKMYKILIEPLILPLIVYYTHLWTYGAWILSFFLNLLQAFLKIFM